MGIDLPHPVEGLPSAHMGHDHIKDHEIDLLLMRLVQSQCLLPAACLKYIIAQGGQHLSGQGENRILIVDKKYRAAAGGDLRDRVLLFRFGYLLRCREIDGKGGAAAGFRLDVDVPSMSLDDAIG